MLFVSTRKVGSGLHVYVTDKSDDFKEAGEIYLVEVETILYQY